MKVFFSAVKKITYHKRATYVNSEYRLKKKEKQSLLIGITLCLTPILVGISMLIVT